MTDSNERDSLSRRLDRNREQRIAAIKRWVSYVESTDADVRGKQLNTLVESQLDAARGAEVSAEQYGRVERAGETYRNDDENDADS